MKPLVFLLPDTSGPTPTPTPTPKKITRGPFDKRIMAALDEAEEIAAAAQTAPYAALLGAKYDISSASVTQLALDIAECERLFGAARAGNLGSQTSTDAKAQAMEDIIEAIDEFRTGARLTLKTEADLRVFGVGVDLERNGSVLAQLAQTILDDPRSPTLRGIDSAEMTALQSALDAWKSASQAQLGGAASGEGNRANALALFKSIEERAREIKIAIDGAFSYKKPTSVEARKLFHLPLKQGFAPVMFNE